MDSSRLLSDREIAEALQKRKLFKGMDLSGAIDEGDRLTAKAQLVKTDTEWKARIEEIFKEFDPEDIFEQLCNACVGGSPDTKYDEDDWCSVIDKENFKIIREEVLKQWQSIRNKFGGKK